MPAAEQAPRHDLLLVDVRCCRGSSATTSTPSTRSAATPTTSSTSLGAGAGRRGPGSRRWRDFGDRFFADLDRGRSDDPVLKAVVHTVRAFDIDPDCFRRFLRSMAMDLTVDALRDLRRPARLHGRLGRGDRRDDAADPRAARPGRRGAARPRPRATRSSSPTSSATSARTSTAAASYLPQEDLRRFGADPTARRGTPEWCELMRFEIARCRRALRLGRRRHRAAPGPRRPRCVRPRARASTAASSTCIEAAGLRRVRAAGPGADVAEGGAGGGSCCRRSREPARRRA